MTDIYTAIMKAAAHIERNPKEFKFFAVTVPAGTGCGTPGCALGWIGTFLGLQDELSEVVVPRALGFRRDHWLSEKADFYEILDGFEKNWKRNAAACASALRLYAAKYHAKPVQQAPDWQAMAAVQTIATNARSQDARLTV